MLSVRHAEGDGAGGGGRRAKGAGPRGAGGSNSGGRPTGDAPGDDLISMAESSSPVPLAATDAEPLASAAPAADAATAGAQAATAAPTASAARPPRGDLLPDRGNPFHQHALTVRMAQKKQEKAAAALAKKTAAAAARAAAAAVRAAKAAKVAQERAAAGRPPARRRGSRTVASPPGNIDGAAASSEPSSVAPAPLSGSAATARPILPLLESVIQPAAATTHMGAAAGRPTMPPTPAFAPSAAAIYSEVTDQTGTTLRPAGLTPAAVDMMLDSQSRSNQLMPTRLSPNSDGTLPSTAVAAVNTAANTSAPLLAAEAAAAVLSDFAAVSGSTTRPPTLEDDGSAAIDACNCAAVEANKHLRKRIADLEEASVSDKRLHTLVDEHEKESKKRRVATNRQIKELRKVSTAIQSEVGAVKLTMKAVVKTLNLVGTAINHGNAAMKDICRSVDHRVDGSGTVAPATNSASVVTANVLSELKEAPWAQQMMVRGTACSLLILVAVVFFWTSRVSVPRGFGFYVRRLWGLLSFPCVLSVLTGSVPCRLLLRAFVFFDLCLPVTGIARHPHRDVKGFQRP